MKRSILFVDDEPKVLLALHRLLKDMGREWHIEFAENGDQALRMMPMRQFDVIVADLSMPGLDGEQLLTQVMHRFPQTTRVVLCWNSDRPALPRLFGIAHYYLFKPCEGKALKDMLSSIFMKGELLSDDRLNKLVSQLKRIPKLPPLYVELVREAHSDEASLQRVASVLARDPRMTTKILELINSPFYGLRRPILTPEEAIFYLGIETIKALVLSFQVYSQLDCARIRYCGLDGLWEHGWQTAVLARRICTTEGAESKTAEHAFIAGLLHDIGKLVLADNLPELYRSARLLAEKKQISILQAEREIFGATHAEVGGFLLGVWGLADTIVEAVAFHHTPAWAAKQNFSSLTALHVADVLDHEVWAGEALTIDCPVDLDYLANLDCLGRYAEWQAMCWDALNNSPAEEPAPEYTMQAQLACC